MFHEHLPAFAQYEVVLFVVFQSGANVEELNIGNKKKVLSFLIFCKIVIASEFNAGFEAIYIANLSKRGLAIAATNTNLYKKRNYTKMAKLRFFSRPYKSWFTLFAL